MKEPDLGLRHQMTRLSLGRRLGKCSRQRSLTFTSDQNEFNHVLISQVLLPHRNLP